MCEQVLFLITEKTKTIIDQILKDPEEDFQKKLNKSKGRFSFKTPIELEGDWLDALTSAEVFLFILNRTIDIIKKKLHYR